MRRLTSVRACLFLLASATTIVVLGCGQAAGPSATAPQAEKFADSQASHDTSVKSDHIAATRGNDRIVSATPRRVIYSADVAMQTREFAKAERVIPELVKQFGGYLTDISLSRQQGEQRSGRWQARVPAESFHEFLEGLDDIGVTLRHSDEIAKYEHAHGIA